MSLSKTSRRSYERGFTIVELLIVVVVIAILAAITVVTYNGIQTLAYDSKIQTDLANLKKAIMIARESTGKTFMQISGTAYTASGCAALPSGSDLANLDQEHTCWTRYHDTLNRISNESNMNVRGLLDPWGRPYFIDENEGEGGGCNLDRLDVFYRADATVRVPLSGFTGC